MCPHLDRVLSRSGFCSTFPFMWLKGAFKACQPYFHVSCNSVQRRRVSDSSSGELQLVFSFQSQNASHSWSYLVDQREDERKHFIFEDYLFSSAISQFFLPVSLQPTLLSFQPSKPIASSWTGVSLPRGSVQPLLFLVF